MTKSNGWSIGKEDVTRVKAPICNASNVTNGNECKDPLLIKDKDGYKVRKDNTKRDIQFSPQKLLLS